MSDGHRRWPWPALATEREGARMDLTLVCRSDPGASEPRVGDEPGSSWCLGSALLVLSSCIYVPETASCTQHDRHTDQMCNRSLLPVLQPERAGYRERRRYYGPITRDSKVRTRPGSRGGPGFAGFEISPGYSVQLFCKGSPPRGNPFPRWTESATEQTRTLVPSIPSPVSAMSAAAALGRK